MQLKKFIEQTNGDPKKSYYTRIARAESGGNDNAVNPAKGATASGRYQFIESTWKGMVDKYKLGYSLDDRFNAEKSQKVMELFTRENENYLTKKLGRSLNETDLYSAHFLGAGGAEKFLKTVANNPNKLATEQFSGKVLSDNKSVMYNADGTPRRVGEVYAELGRRMGNANSEMPQTEGNQTEFTDLQFNNYLPNIAGITLDSSDEESSKDDKVVESAEKELQKEDRKLNAFDNFKQQQQQLAQLVPAQQEEQDTFSALQTYQGVNQFVSQPMMQSGGKIPVSPRGLYDYPNQTVQVPTDGSITMKGLDYPVLGTSDQTGEQKLMLPGMEYFFSKTNSVTEVPVKDNENIEYAQQGGTVSNVWEERTGTDWSEAKRRGLTDGSYDSNLKLKAELEVGKYGAKDSKKQSPTTIPSSFNEAFKVARQELGANKIFEYEGRKYGTNLAGEKFTPTDDELKKYSLDTPTTKDELAKQNKMVSSPYTSKEVVKLEPEYKDWEDIKKRNIEVNKMKDADKIVNYQANKKDEQYLIVDKKSARMHLYKGDKMIDSFEIGVGENKGDAQTVTKIIDGKTDWLAGNKSTGAGIYTVSNIDPKSKHYYDLPSFNLQNEQGIEVATTIHGTPTSRRKRLENKDTEDNRMTNGCINGKCQDLKDLYSKYNISKGTKLYVLPEDEGNTFQMQDGKLILKTNSKNREESLTYTDKVGNEQKGQGINFTTNTLKYKPIKISMNKKEFEEDVYQWNDFNDDKEYETTTKPFMQSLVTNKQKVMKASKISSDTYNELAKMAFGIYGTESNFGDTHSAVGNAGRLVNKVLDSKASSSPDYKSKAETYGLDDENRSVGLTQIRFSYLNNDEKKALKEVGITTNKDFLDPNKAALGTVVVLGIRYNQQLTDAQKKNVWEHLPKKWNNRGNYKDRVKNNSRYISIKQLDK